MNDHAAAKIAPHSLLQDYPEDPRDARLRRKAQQRVRIEKSTIDFAHSWSVIGIFAIMAVAGIYFAAPVLMPLTLAVVVGLILGLLADRLGALGIPPMLTGLILSSAFALIIVIIANTIAQPLADLAANAPQLLQRPIERIMPYLERMQWLHVTSATFRGEQMSLESLMENAGTVLSTVATKVTPALVQGLIFFAALILFLGSRHTIRKTLITAFRNRARRLSAIRTIRAIETALGFYFATASLLYAAVGVSMALIAWIGGLGMPVLWGFLAFLSSFIPFLGITGMTLAVACAGVMIYDNPLLGLAPAAVFCLVHGIIENLVTPAVMGRRLEINPFMIFVAIIFWTWMWGAVGAMLALPLSLIAMCIANELLPKQKIQPNLPG